MGSDEIRERFRFQKGVLRTIRRASEEGAGHFTRHTEC